MIARIFQIVTSLAAAQLVLHGMQTRVQNAAKRSILFAIAGVVAIAAAGFLLAALWLWLASLYGAMIANLVIGGGLLAVVLVITLIAVNIGKSTQPQVAASLSGDTSGQIGDLLAE